MLFTWRMQVWIASCTFAVRLWFEFIFMLINFATCNTIVTSDVKITVNVVELCLCTLYVWKMLHLALVTYMYSSASFFFFSSFPGMAGGKYRSFLIHVKAVNDRGTEEICNGGIRPVVRIPSLKPQTNKGHSLASLLAKVAAGKVLNSQERHLC